MLNFYNALNFRANELNDHEIQALQENSIFLENANIFIMHQSIPAAPIPHRANPRALALFLFWVANSRG